MLKTNILRVVSLFLVLATLGVLVIGCSKPVDNNQQSGANNGGTTQTPGGGDGGSTVLVDNVPDMNMDGYTMTILCRENVMFLQEAIAEQGTGDQVTQAIFDRNDYIEGRFNCIIDAYAVSEENESTLTTTFNKSVSAGSMDYTMALGHMMYTATECLNGTMLDLKSLPYVNIERDYWHQSMNDAVEVNNRIYFTASDFCTSSTYYTWLMVFNMEQCEERDIDVYGMVEDGTWTIDKLTEIVSANYRDNGDNVVDFETDSFGFITHYNTALTNWVFALEVPVTTNPKDGDLTLTFGNERSVLAGEKLYDLLFESSDGAFILQDKEIGQTFSPENPDMKITTKFGQGGSLFVATKIFALENLRNSEVKYGIVPYPKFDTNQTNYYSHVDGRASLLFVPYILPEVEYEWVGGLLEALTCATTNKVMPVIQSAALLGRYSEDSEAYKHLQSALDGRSYAFAYVYDMSSKAKPYWIYSKMMAAKTDNLASVWGGHARTGQREFRTFATKLKALHNGGK